MASPLNGIVSGIAFFNQGIYPFIITFIMFMVILLGFVPVGVILANIYPENEFLRGYKFTSPVTAFLILPVVCIVMTAIAAVLNLVRGNDPIVLLTYTVIAAVIMLLICLVTYSVPAIRKYKANERTEYIDSYDIMKSKEDVILNRICKTELYDVLIKKQMPRITEFVSDRGCYSNPAKFEEKYEWGYLMALSYLTKKDEDLLLYEKAFDYTDALEKSKDPQHLYLVALMYGSDDMRFFSPNRSRRILNDLKSKGYPKAASIIESVEYEIGNNTGKK